MKPQTVIVIITAGVILSIMFFAYKTNKRCSREGMEASSTDQAMQAALANGIVINTPDHAVHPHTCLLYTSPSPRD